VSNARIPPMGEQLTRETFGPHLRQLRERAGLSQRIAARAAGVSETTWMRWEHGARPDLWRAARIARALAISLPELLAPDDARVHVAELTVTREALERIRRQGAPEAERLAATLTAPIAGKLRAIADRRPYAQAPKASVRYRPVASQVRSRIASSVAKRGA
jgi:transcriptional regulator with XRE-family HTH domain